MIARKTDGAGARRVNIPSYFTTYSTPELSALQYGLYSPQKVEIEGESLCIIAAKCRAKAQYDYKFRFLFKAQTDDLSKMFKKRFNEDFYIFVAYLFKALHAKNGHRYKRSTPRHLYTALELSLSDYASFRGISRQKAGVMAKDALKTLTALTVIKEYDLKNSRKKGGVIEVHVNEDWARGLQQDGFWIELPLPLFSLNLKEHPYARALYCYMASESNKNLKRKHCPHAFKMQDLINHTALGRKLSKNFRAAKLKPLKDELDFLASSGLITWTKKDSQGHVPLKDTEIEVAITPPAPKCNLVSASDVNPIEFNSKQASLNKICTSKRGFSVNFVPQKGDFA